MKKLNLNKDFASQLNIMNTRKNMYSVLSEKEYEFTFPAKITHLELHPVALLIKYKKITHLEPHPITHLFKSFLVTGYAFRDFMRPKKFEWLHFSPIFNSKYRNRITDVIKNRTSSEIYHSDNTLLESKFDLLLERVKDAKAKYHSVSDPRKDGESYDDWEDTFDYYKKIYDDFQFKYDWEVEKKEGTLDQFLDRCNEYDAW